MRRLTRKGGASDRTVLSARAARALDNYLDGRDTGPLFTTTTGRWMTQPEVWKTVRRIAQRRRSMRASNAAGARRTRPRSPGGGRCIRWKQGRARNRSWFVATRVPGLMVSGSPSCGGAGA